MSKRYSGKSFKDSSVMKKAKLSSKERRKLKREKKIIKNEFQLDNKNASTKSCDIFLDFNNNIHTYFGTNILKNYA